jgi:hypothetical protein
MPVQKRKSRNLRNSDKNDERRARLAAALRENLKKRKDRARALTAEPVDASDHSIENKDISLKAGDPAPE